jgi:hypothetical protein
MAREIATRLGVPVKLVPYARPNEIADAAGTNAWDIANIGAEPQRAAKISFTTAYCEIEATYLVPAGSPITSMDQVDRKGIRICSGAGAPIRFGSSATSSTPSWCWCRAAALRPSRSSSTRRWMSMPGCGRA